MYRYYEIEEYLTINENGEHYIEGIDYDEIDISNYISIEDSEEILNNFMFNDLNSGKFKRDYFISDDELIELIEEEVSNTVYSKLQSSQLYYNYADYGEMENQIIYGNIHPDEFVSNLISAKASYIEEVTSFVRDDLIKKLDELTKDDKNKKSSELTQKEIIRALNNSIEKFMELHYKQPQELNHILINYEKTPVNNYLEIVKNRLVIDKDIPLLTKVFKQHKEDMQGRIYNYDLFSFLYYSYGLFVSFEHLYNSKLLKSLGAYTYKKDREKPILKSNTNVLLEQHLQSLKYSQYKINIYLKNFIEFIEKVNTKHLNRYLLSYLVDLSHELKASKEVIQAFSATTNLKNITYKELPQPINTLLKPLEKIIN